MMITCMPFQGYRQNQRHHRHAMPLYCSAGQRDEEAIAMQRQPVPCYVRHAAVALFKNTQIFPNRSFLPRCIYSAMISTCEKSGGLRSNVALPF